MMRNRVFVVFVICLFLSPVMIHAQSYHNLEWIVEEGDEIDYILQRKYIDEAFAQYITQFAPFIEDVDEGNRIICRVDYLEEIPESTNRTFFMSNCTLMRFNDSMVVTEDMGMMVIPVGGWNITIGESNQTSPFSMSIVNTTDEWGTVMSGEFFIAIILIKFHMEFVYYKANGTLSRLWIRVELAGTPSIDILLKQWRPNITSTLPLDPGVPYLLYTGIGMSAVIVLIIGAIIYRRRRRKALPTTLD